MIYKFKICDETLIVDYEIKLFEKYKSTDSKYPRNYNVIKKQ